MKDSDYSLRMKPDFFVAELERTSFPAEEGNPMEIDIIDNEGLCAPKETDTNEVRYVWDSEIYATVICDDCDNIQQIKGTINWD